MANRVDVQYVQFYTDGSAAKKIATPLPKKRVQERPVQKKMKRKVIRIDMVAILSLAVCVALLATLGLGVGKLQKAQEDNARMTQYVEKLSRDNETLAQEYAASYDLNEIEKTAIALGMIHGDEASHRGVTVQMGAQTPAQPQMQLWHGLISFFANIFA